MKRESEMEDFGRALAKLAMIRYGKHAFHAQCPTCGEPVKPDQPMSMVQDRQGDYVGGEPNATCPEHGRVEMKYAGRVVKEDPECHP